MKPRKIVVKVALRASLRDQPFGLPLDHESCRGFPGAYRRDGRVRVLAIRGPIPSTKTQGASEREAGVARSRLWRDVNLHSVSNIAPAW
jgi:hypothetical protein